MGQSILCITVGPPLVPRHVWLPHWQPRPVITGHGARPRPCQHTSLPSRVRAGAPSALRGAPALAAVTARPLVARARVHQRARSTAWHSYALLPCPDGTAHVPPVSPVLRWIACPCARSQQELLAGTRLLAQGGPPETADGRVATGSPVPLQARARPAGGSCWQRPRCCWRRRRAPRPPTRPPSRWRAMPTPWRASRRPGRPPASPPSPLRPRTPRRAPAGEPRPLHRSLPAAAAARAGAGPAALTPEDAAARLAASGGGAGRRLRASDGRAGRRREPREAQARCLLGVGASRTRLGHAGPRGGAAERGARAQRYARLADRLLAYEFQYPVAVRGQPVPVIQSRRPERYSSAAPLTADARQARGRRDQPGLRAFLQTRLGSCGGRHDARHAPSRRSPGCTGRPARAQADAACARPRRGSWRSSSTSGIT